MNGLKKNREVYDDIMKRLADDSSRRALHAYCMVNETDDAEYLLQDDIIIKDMFDFEGLHLTEEEKYVDIGAWIGDTIELFTKKTGGRYEHIYAVEPDPDSLEKLRENVGDYEDISIYSCGLGSKEGEVFLAVDEEVRQSTRLISKKEDDSQISVKIKTLDELFGQESVSLVKIFVPFLFPDILQGGKECLLRDRPRLLVNIAMGNDTKFFEVIRWLLDLETNYQVALRFDMAMSTRLTLCAY